MTEFVKNWLKKADEDIALIEILLKEERFLTNPVCFHAQQAAEKYFKGYLAYNNYLSRKIHDLEVLATDCLQIDKEFKKIKDAAIFLNKFYIESRYPDDYVKFSREDALRTFEAAKEIKNFVLEKIK